MLKLGKLPARPNAIKLKFSDYFDRSKLPTPPKKFGHINVGQPWGMYGNDNYGDCVWAGAAHETMVWCGMGDLPKAMFSEANVLSDYSAVTGFDPKRPDTDQGTDMQKAASYRRATGIVDAHGTRHKVDAYVALRVGHPEDLALATYLTGACGVGVRFPDSAMDQFNAGKPWTLIKGDKADEGHYIPCVGRNSADHFMVVTWGRLQAMTPEWYEHFCDEVVCYLSLEAIREKTKTTPDGFIEAALRDDLKHIAA